MVNGNLSRRGFLTQVSTAVLGACVSSLPCYAEAEWPAYRLPREFYNAWHQDSNAQYLRDLQDAQNTLFLLTDAMFWEKVQQALSLALMARYQGQASPWALSQHAQRVTAILYGKIQDDFAEFQYSGYTPYVHYLTFNPETYSFELSWRYQKRICECVKNDYTFFFFPIVSDEKPVTLATRNGSAQAFWFYTQVHLGRQQAGVQYPTSYSSSVNQRSLLPGTKLPIAGVLHMPNGTKIVHTDTVRLKTVDDVYHTYVVAKNSPSREAKGIVTEEV